MLRFANNELLEPLIEHHGIEAVVKVGLRVLGFPPSWSHCTSEILKIQDALEKG